MRARLIRLVATGCVAAGCLVPAALAAESDAEGWSDTAELSFVLTQGNSESSSLGFKNTLGRSWDRSSFKLRAGGIRVDTKKKQAPLVDAADPPNLVVPEITETTAENYFLSGRFDRQIAERLFWYAGAGWDRNRFAGIDNRYVAFGGVGNIWYDRADLKFKTDYALSYTDQQDVVEIPGSDETFVGLRFSWDYMNKFGKSAGYENSLVLDENLDQTSDWRVDMVNSVTAALTDKLALQLSLQFLYDNDPSFEELLATEDTLGNPVDPPVTQLRQLDELDTILTVSLVVKF